MKIDNCDKCPSLVSSRSKIVSGYGDENAEIMFVGLAPGRNGADITGVPFTRDPSGVIFQTAMIRAGFSLETDPRIENPRLRKAFVTNIVKCNPKNEKGNNRYPTNEEIENCVNYFEIEKNYINPKIIVLLGKTATEYLLKIKCKSFIKFHNNPIEKNNTLYIPFIHPSYVIRGAYNKDKYLNEFSDLKNKIGKR
jgi:uracil-DNA glycosylase family 4